MSVAEAALGEYRLVFFHSALSGDAGGSRVPGAGAPAGRNHGTFNVVRVAEEERPDLLERFRIETVPTLVVVEHKAVKGRLERPRGCREIEGSSIPG